MSFSASKLRGRVGRTTMKAMAGGACAVMLATIGFAVPASASVRSSAVRTATATPDTAGTLHITTALCVGGDFNGSCEVQWTGGTAPYTVTWEPLGDFFGTVSGFDSATRTATISGACAPGGELEAIATIHDSAGHTIQAGGGADCDS
jgi:hypothetical protein